MPFYLLSLLIAVNVEQQEMDEFNRPISSSGMLPTPSSDLFLLLYLFNPAIARSKHCPRKLLVMPSRRDSYGGSRRSSSPRRRERQQDRSSRDERDHDDQSDRPRSRNDDHTHRQRHRRRESRDEHDSDRTSKHKRHRERREETPQSDSDLVDLKALGVQPITDDDYLCVFALSTAVDAQAFG